MRVPRPCNSQNFPSRETGWPKLKLATCVVTGSGSGKDDRRGVHAILGDTTRCQSEYHQSFREQVGVAWCGKEVECAECESFSLFFVREITIDNHNGQRGRSHSDCPQLCAPSSLGVIVGASLRLQCKRVTPHDERGVVKPLRFGNQRYDMALAQVFDERVFAREVGTGQAEVKQETAEGEGVAVQVNEAVTSPNANSVRESA